MSDSDGAWDDDDFEVPDLTANKTAAGAGAGAGGDKFADEDAEEEKPVVAKNRVDVDVAHDDRIVVNTNCWNIC